jgi:predicted phage terminase large subunit-like protein
MKKLETTPDFETLYQQNPAGRQTLRIKAQHFLRFSPASLPPLPIVLSIDPGHRGGEGRSYSVIQAWGKSDDRFSLFDQWREQCRFDKLRQEYWAFVRKHRPVTALIEATANGPALIADARRRPSVNVVPVSPDGTSKIERFREQAGLIRKGRICLPEGALWIGDFITELVEFPSAGFDDQVDATTQYLGWMAGNPSLTLPPPRAVSVGRTFSGLITAKTPASANTQISGCVLGLRYRK